MPTYEYTCKSCGQNTDAVQSFTDDPLTVCPNCSGPLRKVFGNIGISFKGSGFYKNDSRSSKSSAKLATGDGSSPTSKDGAAKTDGASTAKEPSSPAKDTSGSSSGGSGGSKGAGSNGSNGSSTGSSSSSKASPPKSPTPS